MPSHQGKFDGLCGPYAIANAFERAGLREEGEALFKTACKAMGQERWPQVLWEGTRFGDLKRMVRACLDSSENWLSIEARYPFQSDPPATNEAFWERFDAHFEEDPQAVCAIIGITRPHDHWLVVTRDGGRLRFIDSAGGKLRYLKNRASLFAGERRQKPGQWLICRDELIVLRRPG